jgi:hypothetical protein
MAMDMKLEIYGALCETSKFVINGIEADAYDFGDKDDEDPDNAEDYGCGDMQFTSTPPTKEVLEKYSITEDEYRTVCEELNEGLSFGCCGWCV